jgi:hypothetical protein
MYPTLDTNELDITADYSSDAVLKSGIGTATISVKSESLVYVPDSVDVQFRFKPRLDKVLTMGDLNINDFTTTSIYSPIWYIEGWHHNYDRLNNDCGLFEDTVNVVNSSTAADPSLTFSLKPSNTIFYSGSLPVTLSVFDQYIDTTPDDFSYTYNADNLTASVTGFADPDHITHMNANRLYIPDTVINSDDGQTYTVTSIAGYAFAIYESGSKKGLAYDLLEANNTTYPGIK